MIKKQHSEFTDDDDGDFTNIGDVWGEEIPLKPELIEGVLREGHKMMIAGPSKAGKSFSLIELATCISYGLPWMGRLTVKAGKSCT